MFLTGQGWDAMWQAKGAKFKVHKFVLALFSPFLKVSKIIRYNIRIFYSQF